MRIASLLAHLWALNVFGLFAGPSAGGLAAQGELFSSSPGQPGAAVQNPKFQLLPERLGTGSGTHWHGMKTLPRRPLAHLGSPSLYFLVFREDVPPATCKPFNFLVEKLSFKPVEHEGVKVRASMSMRFATPCANIWPSFCRCDLLSVVQRTVLWEWANCIFWSYFVYMLWSYFGYVVANI